MRSAVSPMRSSILVSGAQRALKETSTAAPANMAAASLALVPSHLFPSHIVNPRTDFGRHGILEDEEQGAVAALEVPVESAFSVIPRTPRQDPYRGRPSVPGARA